ATAGAAFTLSVAALDAFNNTATRYGGPVHFTSSDGQAVLPGHSTLTHGTGSFSATLQTAGNQAITPTHTATTSLTRHNALGVTGPPARAPPSAVSPPPRATAGGAFSFSVAALDAFNNTATAYGGTVHFSSSDGNATLPADGKLSNGTATFSATLRTAGNQRLT